MVLEQVKSLLPKEIRSASVHGIEFAPDTMSNWRYCNNFIALEAGRLQDLVDDVAASSMSLGERTYGWALECLRRKCRDDDIVRMMIGTGGVSASD